MTLVTTVEEWLVRATRDLSDDAVEHIRTEITEHYQTALDSGYTPEAALASLGEPKAANRQYRRVYLTRKEAVAAGALASFRKSLKEACPRLPRAGTHPVAEETSLRSMARTTAPIATDLDRL